MSRNYLRILGSVTLLLNPALFADTFVRALTQTQLLRAFVLMAFVELVGFGLAFLRKWAALYFSIPLFCFGLKHAFVSIYAVAFPLNLLAMLFGLSLMLPLVVTISIWKQLTWGRSLF